MRNLVDFCRCSAEAHPDNIALEHGSDKLTYGELLAKRPERLVENAVKGMLPKNTLGRNMLRKLKVYAGPDHPHQAQQPVPFTITQVAQPAGTTSASAR